LGAGQITPRIGLAEGVLPDSSQCLEILEVGREGNKAPGQER